MKTSHLNLEDACGKKGGSVGGIARAKDAIQDDGNVFEVFFALKILHHNMNGKDMAVVCLSNRSRGSKGLCCMALKISCSTHSMAGSDARVEDRYNKYLDTRVATRVHFNSHLKHSLTQHGYSSNYCLFRAKNHVRWLLTSIDVDEYIVYSRPVTKFYKLSSSKQTKFTASANKMEVLSMLRVPAIDGHEDYPKRTG